jgi:hypothetical protein
MRKLLLIVVTLSLGTFALAQMAGNSGSDNMQGAGNDWYNQHLAAQVQQFQQIAAATGASTDRQLEDQSGALPASMAANAGEQGAGNDWYNQKLAGQVQEFTRIKAATASPAQ